MNLYGICTYISIIIENVQILCNSLTRYIRILKGILITDENTLCSVAITNHTRVHCTVHWIIHRKQRNVTSTQTLQHSFSQQHCSTHSCSQMMYAHTSNVPHWPHPAIYTCTHTCMFANARSLLLQQDVQCLVPVFAALLVGLVDPLLPVAHLSVAHHLFQVVHSLQHTRGWGTVSGNTVHL